jgi:alkanesulfonate monooxygenase SsuD/methylene tetrahydromethanopterin reductase-like flavin-dependent oxidoreductase (luciferase family)
MSVPIGGGDVRIGAILSPVDDWTAVLEAARAADELGLDAVGFWDHYHSPRPEWGYVCGWSGYGYLAATTRRVRLVPMVLNNLHYEPGVLAKESSVLSIVSGGRFELAIGAGDWPASFAAWGRPYPDAVTRLALLEETVRSLQRIWTGEAVTLEGEHIRLVEAASTPAPPVPPRIVVGVGASRRTLASAVRYADEVNVYADRDVIEAARQAIEECGRSVELSVFLSWEWDKWPGDPRGELTRLTEVGVDRVLVSIGGSDMPDRLHRLASAG